MFSWKTKSRLPNREAWFVILQNMFPLLQWTSDEWHCTWWCEACMQLLGHGIPFHESPAAQFFVLILMPWKLELFICWISVGDKSASALSYPTLWLYLVFHFPIIPHTFKKEYLAMIKFYEPTYWKYAILSQYHASIELFKITHFFHKCCKCRPHSKELDFINMW